MFLFIVFNFLIGLLVGYIFEFVYRSFQAKKIIRPKFINLQIYGLTTIFLSILYLLNISQIFKLILIFIFPTLIEFTTGYLYLKTKQSRLWDYSHESFNFMGIICLRFSLFWFIIAIVYYFFILSSLIQLLER